MDHFIEKYEYKQPENQYEQVPSEVYRIHAKEWLRTAKMLHENNISGGFGPYYYIHFHACELLLKAFLLDKGKKHEVLKKSYIHKLDKLINSSIEEGLQIEEKFKTYFDFLINMNFEHMQRYPLSGDFTVGDKEFMNPVVLIERSEEFYKLVDTQIRKKEKAA